MSLEAALARMPQKGAMQLLERILDLDKTTIRCLARDHRAADYPLRIEGRLMGASLVELGAQAAAAHASLHGVGGDHAGLLLSLYNVRIDLADADLAVGCFVIAAEQVFFDDGMARYRFSIRDEAQERLCGEAMLKMQAIDA
jgi:predicted hotdog family 3-hydroxylacyl-ACP dehydratase